MNTTVEKTRPDDVLGNLTEDQQNAILDWCEEFSYREALKKIAAPPPGGLGLTVHYTSLRSFYLKRFPERFLRDRTASMTHWEEVARQIEAPELGVFWVMAKEALEKYVFSRLNQEEFDQRDISSLLRLALRMEDQRLKWHAQFGPPTVSTLKIANSPPARNIAPTCVPLKTQKRQPQPQKSA
jgi:hypothetical protein